MPDLLETHLESAAWLHWIALAIVAAPLASALLLGALTMLGRTLEEREIAWMSGIGVGASFLASVATGFAFLTHGALAMELRYGDLYELAGRAFSVHLLVDRLSMAMVLTTALVTALVARFSVRYLHRDPGFLRYFILLSVFDAGMQLLVLAGSYDVLFIGWEMVGLSSFLLVSFFQLRDGPARGGLRAFVTYRITDIGLLVAGVLLHQATGSAELEAAFGSGAWPHATTHLDALATTPIALALLLSTIGKSALFPASGWLPRAMEGPTPSSALFYGALSVHAGIYLLLRSAPLFETAPVGATVLVVIGALTVLTSTLAGRVQSDIKSALAYATSAQVGLMATAVGIAALTRSGVLAMIVVLYMVAHALLRTLQLLRAPSALRDAQEIAAALPDARPATQPASRLLSARGRTRLYMLALHRFFLDELLDRLLVGPVLAVARAADALERRWVAALSGLPPGEASFDDRHVSNAPAPDAHGREAGPVTAPTAAIDAEKARRA